MSDDLSHSHSHSHSHGAIPGGDGTHVHDYASANRDHFDEETSVKYDQRSDVLELVGRLSKAIVKANPKIFREEDDCETEMLDFACGPGQFNTEKRPFAFAKSLCANN